MKLALTDSKHRALCLHYRNGQRCRRLATRLVVADVRCRCEECAAGLPVVTVSATGFTVREVAAHGWIHREYLPIQEA